MISLPPVVPAAPQKKKTDTKISWCTHSRGLEPGGSEKEEKITAIIKIMMFDAM